MVSTLTFIEERLNTLQVAWGPNITDSDHDGEVGAEDDERVLLNGPALDGEGIEQDAIDRLLSGTDDGTENAAAADEPLTGAAGPAGPMDDLDEAIAEPGTRESSRDKPAKAAARTAPAKPAAASAESSQAEIDALFD